MTPSPISRQFADFVTALSYESLPEPGIDQLKTFFLDWLASAFAGSRRKPVTLIRDMIRTMGGTPEAVMIPGNTRTNCLFAALANGASSHMVEMDDLHRESILHPAAAIIPAVLAAAQRDHASGKQLLAALLSKNGFTGATTILEGKRGFFRATSPEFNLGKCTAGLGENFMFMKNSLKYYASCGHTHSAVEATIQALSNEDATVSDIASIHVRIYQAALDLLGDIKPHTPFGAKFNLPFCIATAAKFRQAGLDDFTMARLKDPDIAALMKRIILEGDDALSREYPRKWAARVEVRLNNGRILQGRVDHPKGDPENPLSREDLTGKFRTLTRDILDPGFAGVLIDRIMNLENQPDVDSLLDTSP
jgi:2-methylcitrate dehydratase PrpD